MTLKQLAILILAGTTISSEAKNLDNLSRANIIAKTAVTHSAKAKTSSQGYYPVIIEINNERALEELAEIGVIVYYRRANFLLASVPTTSIGDIDKSQYIRCASIAKIASCTNDEARNFTNVNAVHNGSGTIKGYDGSGVICGICDLGFDPNHIAFKDKLAMMSQYDDFYGKREVYAPHSSLATQSEYPETDSSEETHGTHTSNTMAGGTGNNPYYGVAPGAELAVSTSGLSEMALLCGIEDVIAYAKEQNKPAAINLSVSSFLGPHDGTDIVNQYIDLLGKEAIICFSVGNFGTQKIYVQHDFTADDNTFGTMIESARTWNGFDVLGAMDFWSDDSRSFEMQLVAYDIVDKKFVYESEWFGGDGEGTFTLESGVNEVFDAHFPSSYMSVAYGIDKNNNRYNAALSYNLMPNEEIEGHHWARYICGWRIKGEPGMHVEGYADGSYSYFRKYGVSGMIDGNSECTESNLCCNHESIAVGACIGRNLTPTVDGGETDNNVVVGTVPSWSSHGTTHDGRALPYICAPGCKVVSATSTPYYEKKSNAIDVAYETTVDGNTYHWHVAQGTSMAAPIVTGTMALWLEAIPTLTVEEAREAAIATAQTGFSDISDVRWGAGCIDAFAGLEYLLNKTGVNDINDSQPAINIVGRRIESTSKISIYDTQGRRYEQGHELNPGLYIVRGLKAATKVVII
jgi:subtilisin family serine protease